MTLVITGPLSTVSVKGCVMALTMFVALTVIG